MDNSHDGRARPVIVIAGRPNVGKSTLFNRLAGRRFAIVSDIAGTTRDRVSTDAEWDGYAYVLIDTGGIEERPERALWEEVQGQTGQAIEQADAVILVVDVNAGVIPGDVEAADLVRRSGKPVIVAANKADNPVREDFALEFHVLGLGSPIPVSAYHGIGITELITSVFALLPPLPAQLDVDSVRVAIAGRPNVGKSALLNALTGEERAIVSPVPGTTRDPVDTRATFRDREFAFLDTAGLRRRGRTEAGIEKFSAIRTIQAIERSHVVVLVMDAQEFSTAQDAHIAGFAIDAFRGVVVVLNKWDLSSQLDITREVAERRIRSRFKFLFDVPVLYLSALTGWGVELVPQKILEVHGEFTKTVPGADLRRVVYGAVAANPPPRHNRRPTHLYRVRQVRTAPPTFVLNTNSPELIHFTYRRYLENRLREAFGFAGSPLRLHFRTGRE